MAVYTTFVIESIFCATSAYHTRSSSDGTSITPDFKSGWINIQSRISEQGNPPELQYTRSANNGRQV